MLDRNLDTGSLNAYEMAQFPHQTPNIGLLDSSTVVRILPRPV